MSEDFYSVLGVDRDASEDEIKRAFRQKASEYHPDVSDDPNAEEKFKRIQEAKEVLLDDEKRRMYDQMGHERFQEADKRGATEGGAAGPAPATAADAAALLGLDEPLVAQLVVLLSLLLVGQHLLGRLGLLELLLCVGVGADVRVVLPDGLAVGLLDLVRRGVPGDSKHVVKILCHQLEMVTGLSY